jgi:hypothetical protein
VLEIEATTLACDELDLVALALAAAPLTTDVEEPAPTASTEEEPEPWLAEQPAMSTSHTAVAG